MFKPTILAAGLFGLASVVAAQPRGLGRAATSAEIVRASISVAPDGTGLPPGRGTPITGRAVYEAKCAACHGMKGEGSTMFPKLVGGVGSLKTAQPVGTIGSYWPFATTVWDYINRAMPYQDPGSLRPDEVYGVTAYLLYLNGIIKQGTELNRLSLPQVEMPNRHGFVDDERPDVR
jgi:cytochrome c